MAISFLSSTLFPPFAHGCSTSFTPKFPKIFSNPTLILCQSTLEAHQKAPTPDKAKLSGSGPEIEGSGAAAPTRGERFLEHHQSVEAAKFVLQENKKKKKKKMEKALKVSLAVASCYGCGAPLQTSEMDAPGYVEPETYELKKKHHQLRKVICRRCRLLSHGHMITAVGGHGGYSGGKQFITAEQLREKLSHLRHEKALIVKLVDIVDFNGSFLARVRDLAGGNPIILVVTKVDLLPKGTDLNCIGDWVVEATTKKKLNVLSVHLTSSKSLLGITGVVSDIQKEKKGRDVYILGSANVGKSAFINALLRKMAERDPVAAAAQKYRPIQSAVPGTTLGPIQIDAFLGGEKLYDTPGVHLHHRLAAVVLSKDLPALAPQSRLRGQSFPDHWLSVENGMESKVSSHGANGFSVFWGGVVRVDLLKVLPDTRLTFYGPKALQITVVPFDKADDFYQEEVGASLTPPTGKPEVNGWRGLETVRLLKINFDDVRRPACDIAISGLGWITVEPFGDFESDPEAVVNVNELELGVHVPRAVEIFVRPPLPVGKAGAEWYHYRELTESEEEVRPRWYF